MPTPFSRSFTKREREYYRMGFSDGYKSASVYNEAYDIEAGLERRGMGRQVRGIMEGAGLTSRVVKPKRKLSAWNKFVKANSKKSEFRYRDGKLNLKKMGVAFRRKKRR